jgi:hypothetical protein
MGRFKFDIKDLFKKRLMLTDYPNLSHDAKELVDYTIKKSLKCNSVLRVRGFRTKYLKPKKANLWFISWSERIELGMAVDENDIFEILKIIYGINEKQFVRLELYNAFAVHKWIIEELKLIVQSEMNELHSEPTEEEKEAGVEELQQFSYYNSLDSFTNGNILIQEEWLKLPYSKIFRKMCLDKIRHDINLTMRENANRKANRNNIGT